MFSSKLLRRHVSVFIFSPDSRSDLCCCFRSTLRLHFPSAPLLQWFLHHAFTPFFLFCVDPVDFCPDLTEWIASENVKTKSWSVFRGFFTVMSQRFVPEKLFSLLSPQHISFFNIPNWRQHVFILVCFRKRLLETQRQKQGVCVFMFNREQVYSSVCVCVCVCVWLPVGQV